MIINTRVKSSIFLYLKSERRNMATVKLWAIKRRLDVVVNYTTNDEKVSSNDYINLHNAVDYIEADYKTESKQ